MSSPGLNQQLINRNVHYVFGYKFWLVCDVTGFLCASFALCLMAFAQYGVLACVLLPHENLLYRCVNLVIFQFIFFFAFASYVRTMFTDPGAVGNDVQISQADESTELGQSQILMCQKCNTIKPERAHHCSICQRCIQKMDHHCPWVNNCVGGNNQKFFVLFILYIGLLSIHGLLMIIPHFLNCINNGSKECPCGMNESDGKVTVSWVLMTLMAESVLFGSFAIIIFFAQIYSIWTNQTLIERKQKRFLGVERGIANLKTVFGKWSICWFSPFTQSPPLKVEMNSIRVA